MAADILTYEVKVKFGFDQHNTHTRRVAVGGASNHETTFADIPKIIAISTIGASRVGEITIVSATLVSTEPSSL